MSDFRLWSDARVYISGRLREWDLGDADHSHLCLPSSVALCGFLARAGMQPLIQAGTAYWGLNKFGEDGSRWNVGFKWEDENARAESLLLPEVHVWVVENSREILVDPTCCTFRKLSEVLLGGQGDEKIPDFLCLTFEEVKNLAGEGRVSYEASPKAIGFVLNKALSDDRLKKEILSALGGSEQSARRCADAMCRADDRFFKVNVFS